MAQHLTQLTKVWIPALALAALGCNETHARSTDAGPRDSSVTPDAAQDAGHDAAQDAGHDAGGDASAGKMCAPEVSSPGIYWTCSGPVLGAPIASYTGWATVERSTAHDMVVYVSRERLMPAADDADAGSQASEGQGAHCTLEHPALPTLAVGSKLWLSETHDHDGRGIPRLHDGSQISLREHQSGTVIAAGLDLASSSSTIHSHALDLEQGEFACDVRDDDCRVGGRVAAYELIAHADTPVKVLPGDTAEIQLGGHGYDLSVASSTQVFGGMETLNCADYVVDDRWSVRADLRMRDGSVQLPLEGLPMCMLGNDPGEEPSFGPFGASDVHGSVTYTGKHGSGLQFDAEDGTGFYIERSTLPEPAIGQTFWVDASFFVFVLREKENGAVVSAVAAGSDVAATLSDWLKTSVRFDEACEYETVSGRSGDTQPTHLYTARIASDPETRIEAGRSHQLQLDGHRYDAWFSGVDSFPTLVITRQD